MRPRNASLCGRRVGILREVESLWNTSVGERFGRQPMTNQVVGVGVVQDARTKAGCELGRLTGESNF